MVKKIFFSLVVFFLLIQLISATDTPIKIKTMPFHEVQLTIFDPEVTSSLSIFERFIGFSDMYGDAVFLFSSDEPSFGAAVFIKKDNVKIISKEFSGPYTSGEPLYLELAPSNFELIETPTDKTINQSENQTLVNETAINTNNSINNSINNSAEIVALENTSVAGEGNNQTIIGLAISGSEGIFSPPKVYFLMGIAGIIILYFLINFFKIRGLKEPKEIKVTRLSELQERRKYNSQKTDRERIEEAEKKIIDAQEEIKMIKHAERINDVKKRLIHDEKELIRLRNERRR